MTPKKLSLEPYKGTRDFYPRDQFILNYIFGVWKKVVESYGYLEYGASILEETDLYKAKSGEEIVNDQTYSFVDRGDRNVTIRPEMTPTVARMIAQKRKELTFPVRWYSIPNLFRYERPQRGRLREHWQLNVDMFGVEGLDADVEVIQLASECMHAFGASESQFVIKINNRKLLQYIFHSFFSLTEDQTQRISKLLDRIHKMSGVEFEAATKEIVGSGDKAIAVLTAVRARSLEELPAEVRLHESVVTIQTCMEKLAKRGITNVMFDMGLVRGFDYYTGIVFEMFDVNPSNPRAIFGGGRYDDLVGIFNVEKVSAVGFGWGDVTMKDFLETAGLLPEYHPTTDIYVCHLEGFLEQSNALAGKLRADGIRVCVDLTERKVSSQVKTADKEQIPFVVVVGEEEVKSDNYKLKNFKESKEYFVSEKEMILILKRNKT